ncbi:hypothetical protein ATK17_3788 [Branchiibius hedensis]|uniref:Uncharacterized protein n=1 Tax=Branchiibius hedensis TaxID=672460 RepID=A0A2Y9BN73_9MICO|nr:hypothetical protein [Branchiibius hedensis]PWJ23295.1 hypothetical protein ATK17_3788 [Branchiibius hedensis]SSA58984.1 hypothetical protein SAMN04489750_3788 [Branchiibius hedensis]
MGTKPDTDTEPRDEVCAFLKVRFAGERRFLFVTPSYGTTRLKFHAAMIPTRVRAIAAAEVQLAHAAENGIEAVAVMQGGRRVFHRLATTAKETAR